MITNHAEGSTPDSFSSLAKAYIWQVPLSGMSEQVLLYVQTYQTVVKAAQSFPHINGLALLSHAHVEIFCTD